MEETGSTSSRRRLLGRGLVAAAGAFGLGAARQSTASAAEVPRATELSLYGRHFHLQAPARRSGQLPEKGDRHTAYAELLESPGGLVVGHLTAARLALDSPFAAASSLEIHTFSLAGGTLLGLGTAARGADGHFVVVGGTGRYAGASGTYVARERPRELGGNGTAEFHLTLAGLEAAHGI